MRPSTTSTRSTTLDIVDRNAGNHGMAFATNFNPEINIREATQKGRYYENGEWVVTEPHEIHKAAELSRDRRARVLRDLPRGAGVAGEELPHDPARPLLDDLSARSTLTHLRVIQNIGMARIDPILYNGVEIVPIQFLAVLPDPKSLAPTTTARRRSAAAPAIEGRQGNVPTISIITATTNRLQGRPNAGRRASTTGVPGGTGSFDVGEGARRGAGVFNVEEFDPDPFLAELGEQGLPWLEMFDVTWRSDSRSKPKP